MSKYLRNVCPELFKKVMLVNTKRDDSWAATFILFSFFLGGGGVDGGGWGGLNLHIQFTIDLSRPFDVKILFSWRQTL